MEDLEVVAGHMQVVQVQEDILAEAAVLGRIQAAEAVEVLTTTVPIS
jgi:hypothetical protein